MNQNPFFISTSSGIINRHQIVRVSPHRRGEGVFLSIQMTDNHLVVVKGEEAINLLTALGNTLVIGHSDLLEEIKQTRT